MSPSSLCRGVRITPPSESLALNSPTIVPTGWFSAMVRLEIDCKLGRASIVIAQRYRENFLGGGVVLILGLHTDGNMTGIGLVIEESGGCKRTVGIQGEGELSVDGVPSASE